MISSPFTLHSKKAVKNGGWSLDIGLKFVGTTCALAQDEYSFSFDWERDPRTSSTTERLRRQKQCPSCHSRVKAVQYSLSPSNSNLKDLKATPCTKHQYRWDDAGRACWRQEHGWINILHHLIYPHKFRPLFQVPKIWVSGRRRSGTPKYMTEIENHTT